MEERYPVAYNLGSGRSPWDGWINVDVGDDCDLKADLRNLPIDSDSADAVAAIHVLEHFYEWEVEAILKEWRRILKPGGVLILELPCMDKVFRYVTQCFKRKENLMEFMTLHALWGDPKHKDPLMCHKYGWFALQLQELLTSAGFREVKLMDPKYHFRFRDMRFEAIK